MTFRAPTDLDGPQVTQLIGRCPPLDANSRYCHLLQCSDFAPTCVVAERDGAVVGWVSAYAPPTHPDRLFVWQVAVAPEARGEGLGGRMLDALCRRPAVQGVRFLSATITADNAGSWALFSAFARRRGAALQKSLRFDRERHFDGAGESEFLALIGPFAPDFEKQKQEVA